MTTDSAPKRIRYAVVGLGHIAQAAVLPAFKNATENSVLVALFSDDAEKRAELAKKYHVPAHDYDDYDDVLSKGEIDAVYIAVPNHLHRDYTERAAAAGVHVLCEKPMAVTEEECRAMIEACDDNDVKLMIAYRLHFEEANLKATEIANDGTLGKLRFFSSEFSMQSDDENVRLDGEKGGGPLYDIGVYCLNAARSLFRTEPTEVTAQLASSDDPRFKEVEEMASVVLKFPEDRLATFTCSFGASGISTYRVVGTKGDLRLDPAFTWQKGLKHFVTVDGKTSTSTFKKRDHFAPELIYFSNCLLEGRDPEPSGWEGLADVRVIEAIFESAHEKKTVKIAPVQKSQRPTPAQQIDKPATDEPELVNVESPHR